MAGLELGTAKAVAEAAIEIISLTEVVPKAIHLMNRTEFAQRSHIKISKEPFIFTDTPGQIIHAAQRKAAIRKEFKEKGGIAGVINVVAYGYHESRALKQPLIESAGKVNDRFLAEQREVETDLLSEWTALLGGREGVGWLITLVTKADLWWDRREEVMAHYQTGQYYQALGDAQFLNPVVLEYSSIFQKFYGQGSMSGEFQDSDRIRAKAQLISALLAALGKEKHARVYQTGSGRRNECR